MAPAENEPSTIPTDEFLCVPHINIHDDAFSTEKIIVNVSRLHSKLILEPGARMRITSILDSNGQPRRTESDPYSMKRAKERQAYQSSYVFVLSQTCFEGGGKDDNFEVSVSSSIASALKFTNRSKVLLSFVNPQVWHASHVEISFRDVYLTRADMWRLVLSELSNKAVYKGQKVQFLGTVKAQIKSIYVPDLRGRKAQPVQSAWFGPATKPVFRSQSARYVLFIQMSKEMWDFDIDGTGEIMFHKVINGFLPELFGRWEAIGARHLVSIVLFTRMEYDRELKPGFARHDSTEFPNGRQTTLDGTPCKDFYRVLVSDMASTQYTAILTELKREFKVFLRDVSIVSRPKPPVDGRDSGQTIDVIAGHPSAAIRGNILEAINLASSQFSADYVDRDLVRTGLSVVIVTPGTGVFEVDHKMLTMTTDILTENGVSIDLVCLSRMPLHSVPLFKYRPPKSSLERLQPVLNTRTPTEDRESSRTQGRYLANSFVSSMMTAHDGFNGHNVHTTHDTEVWHYGIPHWVDVSFWSSPNTRTGRRMVKIKGSNKWKTRSDNTLYAFTPRVRMYELQMMGVMENEMSDISIPYLRPVPPSRFSHTKARHLSSATYSPSSNLGSYQTPAQSSHLTTPSLGVSLPRSDLSTSFDSVPTPKGSKSLIEWMDELDQAVFKSKLKTSTKGKSTRESGNPDRDDLQYSGSISRNATKRSLPRTPTRDTMVASSKGGGASYLQKTLANVPRFARKGSSSNASEVGKGEGKRGNLSRQISYGLRGFGGAAPKAVPITELSSQLAQPAGQSTWGKRLSPLGSIPPPLSGENVERLQSLTMAEKTDGGHLAPGSTPSRPIDIKRSDSKTSPAGRHARHESTTDSACSGEEDALPPPVALSPRSALAPWLTVLNPSNARKIQTNPRNRLSKWHHAFPRPLITSNIKWKSLCSPASVPLTTDECPDEGQLSTEYQAETYQVTLGIVHEFTEDGGGIAELMRTLVGSRLAHGFQIISASQMPKANGAFNVVSELGLYDTSAAIGKAGSTICLGRGSSIHRLLVVNEGTVEVTKHTRKSTTTSTLAETDNESVTYKPFVRTTLGEKYLARIVNVTSPKDTQDWSKLDDFVAHQREQPLDKPPSGFRFWQARFVLIPAQPYANSRLPLRPINEDTPEETRLEGIRKLTQHMQKYKYIPQSERQFQSATRNRKDTNPLDIMYQTRPPSAVVAAELENIAVLNDPGEYKASQLLPESDLFDKSNLNLGVLARAIQSDRGCKLRDRRWHFRLHYNCFIGFEFTTWLLNNFRGIESRDEAVELGNELMRGGLFQHVEQRHEFRDGNYFYSLSVNYLLPRSESRSGWLGGKRAEQSVPSTPLADSIRFVTGLRVQSSSNSRADDEDNTNGDDQSEGESNTPTKAPGMNVSLSKRLIYDVDHRHRSYRKELIALHIDRIVSPDDCYHLRVDWMNVTPKLIEDLIANWATATEKYGLRLVELPIAEASRINDLHPFRSPYVIKLALRPPEKGLPSYFEPASFQPQTAAGFPYQKAILKRFDFVLDLEAAKDFPPSVNVEYSWGKPDYRYPQYISREGICLAQITDEGDFLLLANRLYNNRSAATRENVPFPSQDRLNKPVTHAQRAVRESPRVSPYASPMIRATPDVGPGFSRSDLAAPEKIKNDIEAFCSDVQALERFYDEVLSKEASLLSPDPGTPSMEDSIGSLASMPNLSLGEERG